MLEPWNAGYRSLYSQVLALMWDAGSPIKLGLLGWREYWKDKIVRRGIRGGIILYDEIGKSKFSVVSQILDF